jgi:UDP-N-acetylmuramoyl-tripeptide--D-alanyl-D-alanine ligase
MTGTTMMTLAQAAAWLPGARLVGDPATAILRVHTDTRSLMAGDLFVALKGERFDANDFLTEARASGAVAAIAHRGLAEAGLAGFEVADSLQALGAIGAGWRSQFTLPLIAVTGSNGKTTVTQMLASILRAADDSTLATVGNFNNEIGVPLTLLRLRAEHRLAVIELGMNHPGEIARLGAMTRPTVALVNNAQREHQEFMATVEAVARENAAVFDALPADGCAVFPHGDEFTPLWRELALRTSSTRRCMTFGDSVVADVGLVAAQWQDGAWRIEAHTPQGQLVCTLRVAGHHNVMNALAATASALAAGIALPAIARGLGSFEPVKGRSQASTVRLSSGRALTLIDDSYNANPDSVRAAIDVLASLPGPRLLVLGDMGEVGAQSPQFHSEVGAYASARGIDTLWALGADTTHSISAFQTVNAGVVLGEARHFIDIDTLNSAVLARLPDTASVLVKGSRFMKMERVVQAIQTAAATPSPSSFTASHPEAGHVA